MFLHTKKGKRVASNLTLVKFGEIRKARSLGLWEMGGKKKTESLSMLKRAVIAGAKNHSRGIS